MITENIEKILKNIPDSVTVLAAAKMQSISAVREAFQAGIRHFGHNYVQEAGGMIPDLNMDATWHMIGHLQRNKAKMAVRLFTQIDTIDSPRLCLEIEKQAASVGALYPVMIEVNSGEEDAKTGAAPEDALELAGLISKQPHLQLIGVMTMGPRFGDPENSRNYFIKTRKIYEQIHTMGLQGVDLRYLSMGMSNDYPIAIDEGANMVRLGTIIFGHR